MSHRLDDIQRLAELETPNWKPRQAGLLNEGVPQAADGIFYVDTKVPFTTAALSSVTLATTAKTLWPVTTWSPLPVGYWSLGKVIRLLAFGSITTAATPGNLTVSVAYGTADNSGILANSAAVALIANQTTISWRCDAYIQCRGVGASGSGGSLFAWGKFETTTALIATANNHLLIPASAPAAVNADTTVSSGVNIQFTRSGSTVETAVVQHLVFQALN